MLGSLLYLAALAAGSPSAGPMDPPKDGVEVIGRMRERYLGKWYRTLTFVQKTTLPDGKVEKWYEAAELPGKLRIDIAPLEGKNTILFRNDSLYEFKAGKLTETTPLIHPLMVLGFDVYAQPLDKTVGQLRELGFDLSKVHEAEHHEGMDQRCALHELAGLEFVKRVVPEENRVLALQRRDVDP
ncbi:MAG TPA: hypothetical protein VM365_09690, partial [Gemmatimonadales bacterium]|nr:hypothetical protein [Gemmatimonadales bacterium]